MKLPILAHDKANHFVYGFVIYFIASLMLNPYISLAIATGFALAKEVKDEYDYKGFDWKDLVITVIAPIALFLKSIL